MNHQFKDLSLKHNALKARYLFFCAALCSPVFYYFMQKIEIGSIDSIPARAFVSLLCFLGFLSTYFHNKHQEFFIALFFNLGRIGWLTLYLYLLHVNHWTIYQRWAYFVLVFMLSGSAFSWKDFLKVAIPAVSAPIILGFFSSDISNLELIHFHIANIAPLFVIGVSIRAHFKFKSEVEVLTKSLVEKSQLAVLGEVAAGVSHEVNSPLMIFSYSLHQLKRQLKEDQLDKERISTLIDKMTRMIERISNIVNALKVYSVSPSDDKFEQVDLNEVIEESLTLYNSKLTTLGITIVNGQENNNIVCMAKKSQISQCFLNLINNAIEACENLPNPVIEINTFIKESYAFIAISDNGLGVSDEVMSKIMHPFFTTKAISSGLGLSVSQGIARGHKGELFLDKSKSASTFVIKLPLA